MKFTTLITIALLSFILAASPASAAWETEAAEDEYTRLYDVDKLRDKIVAASKLKKETFTWRSKDIQQKRWLARWVRPQPNGWRYTHPTSIFVTGFTSRMDLEFALKKKYQKKALDLRTYVLTNTPSVFISTTIIYTGDRKGNVWTPRNKKNAFRYDIFAPGGIDVNPTLGPHKYANQNEIAFVGGIQTKFIYGALEFDETGKHQLRYHINPNYEGDPPIDYPRKYKIPYVYYNSDGSVDKVINYSNKDASTSNINYCSGPAPPKDTA